MTSRTLRVTWLAAFVVALAPTLRAQSPEEDHHVPIVEPSPVDSLAPEFFALRNPMTSSPPLFKQIGADFERAFTSKDTLVVLGVGVGASLLARPVDARIPRSGFNSELLEGTGLDHAFEPGKVVGGAIAQVGGAFTTFALGKLTSSPEIEALGKDLVRAQILNQAMTQVLKATVRRTRPDDSNRASFPSGHASGAFATATVLQRRYGWKVGLPAYGVAGYVAASRLSENKHFLSDVVFGAAVGILAGRTVTFDAGGARFALSPMLTPGGAGVQVSLLPHQ